MNPYIAMSIGGILGILLHAFRVMGGINKRNPKVNFKMVFKEYWMTEYLSLTVSVLCFTAMIYVSSEIVDLNNVEKLDPKVPLSERLVHFQIARFIKLSSIIAGYFADSIVYGFLGVTEQKLKQKFGQREIDAKQPQPEN